MEMICVSHGPWKWTVCIEFEGLEYRLCVLLNMSWPEKTEMEPMKGGAWARGDMHSRNGHWQRAMRCSNQSSVPLEWPIANCLYCEGFFIFSDDLPSRSRRVSAVMILNWFNFRVEAGGHEEQLCNLARESLKPTATNKAMLIWRLKEMFWHHECIVWRNYWKQDECIE